MSENFHHEFQTDFPEVYVTAIDEYLLAKAWVLTVKDHNLLRLSPDTSDEFYRILHATYDELWQEKCDENIKARIRRLSVEEIQHEDSFVTVDDTDNRLLEARQRLGD